MSPITERVEVRDYGDSRTIYLMPFLTKENHDQYQEAYEMDMFQMVDLIYYCTEGTLIKVYL
jgi:ribonucleoside-diphosphate reductase alpha chain